jgi:REP element-mobilizing transposase RayT
MPQSLSNILTHLVFSTSHRDPKLNPEVREDLFPYFTGILRNIGCQTIQIGGVEDHVHILLNLSRTVTVADTVKALKGGTSGWIKDRWPRQKDFAWQAGYGIFSIGHSEVQSAVNYIATQQEHHQKVSYQDEYRELMTLAGIEIDERYVWD